MTQSAQHIGQLFMVGFGGKSPSSQVLDLIRHEQIGGVILFERNMRTAAQTLALTSALQTAAREAGHTQPLLIATDQENGWVRRLGSEATTFPGAMALGAVDDEALAETVANATGRELRALGITMNLAPVVDVSNNAANPVIGVRSFGENPAHVGRLGVATVRGLAAAGIIATLKHFPGHGATRTDSHLGLPTLPHSLDRLTNVELVPFAAGIAAGAPAVMTAHIAMTALPGAGDLPATLDPAVLRGILRERLGYSGLIITDCLEMGGITKTVGTARGAVLALAAGADMLLVSHHLAEQLDAIAAVKAAIENGELASGVIEAALQRVSALKRDWLSWDTLPDETGLSAVGSSAHQVLAARAHARAITVVRDRDGLIPLRLAADERVVVLTPGRGQGWQAVESAFRPRALVGRVPRRHKITLQVIGGVTDVARLPPASLVIATIINGHREPAQIALVQEVARNGTRVVALALGNPYDLAALPDVGTCLAAYDYAEPALDAVKAVLFGEWQAEGRLPVTLPGV